MASNHRIKQVIAAWPFMNAGPKWSAPDFVQRVGELGVSGVELLSSEHWPLLETYNLVCAATKSHTFIRGMNNLGHHPECLSTLRNAIDATAAHSFPNVMTFTGLSDTSAEKNGSKVSAEEGKANCIAGYKKIVGHAERKNVTLVLEPLNSKIDIPMLGHPGYQGDHLDFCMDIIREVSSPSLKVLFDVYHIQVMDGDLISRLRENAEFIGHVQIAGVPGRGEIGQSQEINYPRIMEELIAMGYQGFVGHEWIPQGEPMQGLREAVKICNV